jgi:hypothetical protein
MVIEAGLDVVTTAAPAKLVLSIPGCVTVIVCVSPPAVIVIVAVRAIVDSFGAGDSERVPFPDPLGGETNSHNALLDAVQVVFDTTDAVVFPPCLGALQFAGVTVRVGDLTIRVKLHVALLHPVPK